MYSIPCEMFHSNVTSDGDSFVMDNCDSVAVENLSKTDMMYVGFHKDHCTIPIDPEGSRMIAKEGQKVMKGTMFFKFENGTGLGLIISSKPVFNDVSPV